MSVQGKEKDWLLSPAEKVSPATASALPAALWWAEAWETLSAEALALPQAAEETCYPAPEAGAREPE